MVLLLIGWRDPDSTAATNHRLTMVTKRLSQLLVPSVEIVGALCPVGRGAGQPTRCRDGVRMAAVYARHEPWGVTISRRGSGYVADPSGWGRVAHRWPHSLDGAM